MDTLETLKDILSGMDIDMDASDITEDSELLYDLGLSRSSLTYLFAAIEDDFGIDCSDVDFSQLQTVGDVIEVIEEQM